jgi:tRNA(Ile)-lysidine synthase
MNDKRKYLCAVSGGPDSMALLDKYHNQISLVCHVNYQVRESALRDTNIVIAYCKEKNIKLEILTVTEQMYDEYRKICNNFEAIARFIRYDFFLKCSKKHHLNTILIAHNLDDFLETAIMQKQKNSKTLFYGIKKRTQYHGLNIFRPLLNVRKKDLEKYCLTNHIPYGIDETNFCDKYTRNKIRLEIKTWQTKKFNDTIKEYKKFNEENKNKDKLIQEIYTE